MYLGGCDLGVGVVSLVRPVILEIPLLRVEWIWCWFTGAGVLKRFGFWFGVDVGLENTPAEKWNFCDCVVSESLDKHSKKHNKEPRFFRDVYWKTNFVNNNLTN